MLHRGRIGERGTHDELMLEGGRYSRLLAGGSSPALVEVLGRA